MYVLQVKVVQQRPVDSGTALGEPTMKSLSVNNLTERSLADSPREGLRAKRGRLAPSPDTGLEPKGNENCRVQ
jgi:centromere protein F